MVLRPAGQTRLPTHRRERRGIRGIPLARRDAQVGAAPIEALSALRTTSFDSAAEFLSDIDKDLGEREVEHHLLLGVARAAVHRPATVGTFISVRDDSGLALAGFMTPPRPLILATERRAPSAAVMALADWLAARKQNPHGLIADATLADEFAEAWRQLSDVEPELQMRQRLHVLREVSSVPVSSGTLRQATFADLDVLERWVGAFHSEAMGESIDPELRERVRTRFAAGELYLWDDGAPRSMAASARPTPRGIAINSVYTLLAWRRRGYATSCVAALSRRLLDEGKEFCVLYTDLANPTSNAIYARIGYQPVSDSVLYKFIPR